MCIELDDICFLLFNVSSTIICEMNIINVWRECKEQACGHWFVITTRKHCNYLWWTSPQGNSKAVSAICGRNSHVKMFMFFQSRVFWEKHSFLNVNVNFQRHKINNAHFKSTPSLLVMSYQRLWAMRPPDGCEKCTNTSWKVERIPLYNCMTVPVQSELFPTFISPKLWSCTPPTPSRL